MRIGAEVGRYSDCLDLVASFPSFPHRGVPGITLKTSRPKLDVLLACLLSTPLCVAIIALALAGCQTTAPKTQALATANIPVVASCVDDASIDPLPQTAMPPRTAGPDALAAGAAADLLRYRELARRQQDMLKACAKVK